MEADIFNEFISEDGSPHLGRNVVIHSCNDQESSSSPFFNPSQGSLTQKRAERISNDLYREKYRKLKKVAKGFVFENASLCDEVARLQEKILIAKEERRFLIRKLQNFQSSKDCSAQTNPIVGLPSTMSILGKVQSIESELPPKKKNPVKKRPPPKPTDESAKPRLKKKKMPVMDKRLVMPIPLDLAGRPIFPILLGSLTIHSLGVIVPDRPGYHTEQCIYPVGFCSSRTYSSIKNPLVQCLYQCTVTDSPIGPRFEITPEDDPGHCLVGSSPNEVHTALLKAINTVCGKEVISTEGQGSKFFGLSHATVQNLIQSCPGARKCVQYHWVQFEVAKPFECEDENFTKDYDPTVNFDVFLHMVKESTH